jgi:hypothetical protein
VRNSKRFGIALETVLEFLEDSWEEDNVYISNTKKVLKT